MIIVSGIPFSGYSLLLEKLEKGGIEIVSGVTIYNVIKRDNTKAAYIPSHQISHLKGDHEIIFVLRNLEECFQLMAYKMKKEPHRSAFELCFSNLQKQTIFKSAIKIYYKDMLKNPKEELEKIRHLIPNFKKATKLGFF